MKTSLFWMSLTMGGLLAGCASQRIAQPQIVTHAAEFEPLPVRVTPTTVPQRARPSVPADWYPPVSLEHAWDAIVVHHSGTPNGNMEIFDRWHREGNHWEGVGYDFVIGNGTDSGDGVVEATFRWRQQLTGAHCKTPNNWANRKAIGICLVGNFNEARPTLAQQESLRSLVHFLQQRYHIPWELVYSHQNTPGAIVTECPGRLFDLNTIR